MSDVHWYLAFLLVFLVPELINKIAALIQTIWRLLKP